MCGEKSLPLLLDHPDGVHLCPIPLPNELCGVFQIPHVNWWCGPTSSGAAKTSSTCCRWGKRRFLDLGTVGLTCWGLSPTRGWGYYRNIGNRKFDCFCGEDRVVLAGHLTLPSQRGMRSAGQTSLWLLSGSSSLRLCHLSCSVTEGRLSV